MTLEQKMDGFKSQFEFGGPPYNAPKAVIEVFHRATEDLRQSGLAERALKTGERAPAFTLNNQDWCLHPENKNLFSRGRVADVGTLGRSNSTVVESTRYFRDYSVVPTGW
jgi:hypothetical protein